MSVAQLSPPRCIICSQGCQPMIALTRPFFELPQPSPARQAAIYNWLAKAPPMAWFCTAHEVQLLPAIRFDRDSRLIRMARRQLWFTLFGHPLDGIGADDWRPTKREPIAYADRRLPPPEERQEELARVADRRRRARRRGHRQLRRIANLYQKFRRRGARRHAG